MEITVLSTENARIEGLDVTLVSTRVRGLGGHTRTTWGWTATTETGKEYSGGGDTRAAALSAAAHALRVVPWLTPADLD